MTLVDTWASTAAGAFALSENSLYTTQAFREYFEHLKPDGIIAVTRWEFQKPREALRVVSVAMEALHQLGSQMCPATSWLCLMANSMKMGFRLLSWQKERLHSEEEARVQQHLSDNPDLRLLYTPSEAGTNAFARLIQSNDSVAFARNYPFNVTPVTDNAPFFFFTSTGAALACVLERAGDGLESQSGSRRPRHGAADLNPCRARVSHCALTDKGED